MGQRTCMIIRVKEQNEGRTTTLVYHDQWGIGKCLPNCVIQMFLDLYRKNTTFTHYDFGNYSKAYNITSEYDKEWLEGYDFRNMVNLKTFIDKHHDNNNGGVYIEIKITDYKHAPRVKYCFFTGQEEGLREDMYCLNPLSYNEWMRVWKEYRVKTFDNVFENVAKLVNAKVFKVGVNGKLR